MEAKYMLMHGNHRVLQCEIDEKTAEILSVEAVYDEPRIPLGVAKMNGHPNKKELNKWWLGRSIPRSRLKLAESLEQMGISDVHELLVKGLGLSLQDHYWMQPYDRPEMDWTDVNYFEHDFSDVIGEILVGNMQLVEELDFLSPCSTVGGNLIKKWELIEGQRCLIKGGSPQIPQEPYNEKLASRMHEILERAPYASYDVIQRQGLPYSVCDVFTSETTEFIPAHYVLSDEKKSNEISYFQHYKNICKAHGLLDVDEFMNYMLLTDYLIANTDRHMNNFGILRDTKTLKWIGMAPIFDSGNSLWYDTPTSLICPTDEVKTVSFRGTQSKMIELITGHEWVDLSKLQYLDREFDVILKDAVLIDEVRKERLCGGIRKRMTMLADHIEAQGREGKKPRCLDM